MTDPRLQGSGKVRLRETVLYPTFRNGRSDLVLAVGIYAVPAVRVARSFR